MSNPGCQIAQSPTLMQRSSVPRNFSMIRLLAALSLSALAIVAAHKAWADAWIWAQNDPESGQILLAPVAFLWILWARRRIAKRDMPAAATCVGPLMAAVGWLCWSTGFYTGHDLFWHFGALLLLIGAAITALDTATLVRFWPACLALAFLIPVTGVGREFISGPLQNLTARATEELCEVVGMSVGRYGSVLVVNGREVAIAEACNGLRMIWPLFLVTYVFAFVTPMRAGLRALVLLASPLLAVAANVLRLAPTVWAYGHCDPAKAKAFHDAAGWVMLAACFLILVGIARVLRWAFPKKDPGSISDPSTASMPDSDPRSDSVPHPGQAQFAVAATTLLLIGTAWTAWKMPVEADARGYHLLVKAAAGKAPMEIGAWVGRDVAIPDGTDVVLQPNVVISRKYTDRVGGRRATVLLVQVGDARRLTPHAANSCYPAAGWEIVAQAPHTWTTSGMTLPGMEYEFWRGGFQRSADIAVAEFFLVPDGRVVPDILPVTQRASRATERFFGAAHLQVICDAALPQQEREQIVAEILVGYAPLIRAICAKD